MVVGKKRHVVMGRENQHPIEIHIERENVYCNIPIENPLNIHNYHSVVDDNSADSQLQNSHLQPALQSAESEQSDNSDLKIASDIKCDESTDNKYHATIKTSDNQNILKAGWLYLRENRYKLFNKWFSRSETKFYAYVILESTTPQLILCRNNAPGLRRHAIRIPIAYYNISESYQKDKLQENVSKSYIMLEYKGPDENSSSCQACYEFVFNTNIELDEWSSILKYCSMISENTISGKKDEMNQKDVDDDEFIYAEPKIGLQNDINIRGENREENCVEYDVPKPNKSMKMTITEQFDHTMEERISANSALGNVEHDPELDTSRDRSVFKWHIFRKFNKIYRQENSSHHHTGNIKPEIVSDVCGTRLSRVDRVNESVVAMKSPCAIIPRGPKIVTLINQLNENGQLVLLSRSNTCSITNMKRTNKALNNKIPYERK